MKSVAFLLAVAAATVAVYGSDESGQCVLPHTACQWSGHYLGAAWSDTKFTGPNYRRGQYADHYAECCELCQQAVGCYKFHVVQVVAPDPDEPGSGLTNCFLHGQGAKEFCYSISDEDAPVTEPTEGNPLRRRRLSSSNANSAAGQTSGDGNTNPQEYGFRDVSSGGGDPHLVGFDGRPFDFMGYSGGVFNLLTQESHNLNMLLTDNGMKGLTFIRALAFQYGDKKVKIEAAPYKNSKTGAEEALLTVEFNGMAVEVAALDADNEPPRLEAGELWVSSRRYGNNTQEVHVTSPGLQVMITKHRNSRHLDMTANILRPDMEPMHGVLGQTYRFNATYAQFQGDEIDYLVSGLWANDCKFCTLFKAKEMPHMADPGLAAPDSLSLSDSSRRVLKATEATPYKSAASTANARPKDWARSKLFEHIM